MTLKLTPHVDADECPEFGLRERIAHAYEDDEMLFLDPPELDRAIIGVAERINFGPVVIYDRDKLVHAFMEQGMSAEAADEWVSVNVEGSFIGDRTPLVLNTVANLLW